MFFSDVLLGVDVDDATRGDAERRNDRQRHEAERHKRINPAADAETERRVLCRLILFYFQITFI